MQEVELWSVNVDAMVLFGVMGSQWRTGPGGVLGFDYAVLPLVERRLGFTRRRARRAFEGLQVMEAEAVRLLAARGRGKGD